MTESPNLSPSSTMTDNNVQDNNVGNRGDVAKHAALVALAGLLRARNPGTIRHIETHCFRLSAPLPERARAAWHGHVAALGAAAAPYVTIEEGYLRRGVYRCSAGLVADTLGAPCRLLLAEAHAPTRAVLSAAIEAESLPVDVLVHDAHHLADAVTNLPSLPTLIHVDPFDHPRFYWDTVEVLVAHATGGRGAASPRHDVLVLAFAFDRAQAVTFPAPPAGLVSVGHRPDPPYSLGLWASPDIAPAAQELAMKLGFVPMPAAPTLGP